MVALVLVLGVILSLLLGVVLSLVLDRVRQDADVVQLVPLRQGAKADVRAAQKLGNALVRIPELKGALVILRVLDVAKCLLSSVHEELEIDLLVRVTVACSLVRVHHVQVDRVIQEGVERALEECAK